MKTYYPEFLMKFGTNVYGENLFRIVWSEDRLTTSYGKEVRKYGSGMDCFILEKWVSPEKWGSEIVHDEEALGPFPRRGEYEHCYSFRDELGTVLRGPDLLPLMDLLGTCIERNKFVTDRERIFFLKEQQAKEEKDREQAQLDFIENELGPFQGNAVSGNPAKMTYDKMKISPDSIVLPEGFQQITEQQAKKIN